MHPIRVSHLLVSERKNDCGRIDRHRTTTPKIKTARRTWSRIATPTTVADWDAQLRQPTARVSMQIAPASNGTKKLIG